MRNPPKMDLADSTRDSGFGRRFSSRFSHRPLPTPIFVPFPSNYYKPEDYVCQGNNLHGRVKRSRLAYLLFPQCAVVILSATLTEKRRRQLLGLGDDRPLSTVYPLVSGIAGSFIERSIVITDINSEGRLVQKTLRVVKEYYSSASRKC
jgi:hypothetical protein